jgi:heterodisulfide reductase subunit A
MQSALALKALDNDVDVYVLYRDIRTYGQRESLYRRAREAGVLFFPYDPDRKPSVVAEADGVSVTFEDPVLGQRLCVDADLLCLAAAIEARDNDGLARLFKVPRDGDGWLLEAHQKLRPVEFATDGVYLCGMAHYPKPVEESIAQARAAASRALTILAADHIRVGGVVSRIDEHRCVGCRGCMNVCPYGAIDFDDEQNVARVNEALCKGCGACAATCPSEAPVLLGFSNPQIYAQIRSALCA